VKIRSGYTEKTVTIAEENLKENNREREKKREQKRTKENGKSYWLKKANKEKKNLQENESWKQGEGKKTQTEDMENDW